MCREDDTVIASSWDQDGRIVVSDNRQVHPEALALLCFYFASMISFLHYDSFYKESYLTK